MLATRLTLMKSPDIVLPMRVFRKEKIQKDQLMQM